MSHTVHPGWLVRWLLGVYGEAVVITIYDVSQMETSGDDTWKQAEATLKAASDALE